MFAYPTCFEKVPFTFENMEDSGHFSEIIDSLGPKASTLHVSSSTFSHELITPSLVTCRRICCVAVAFPREI